MPISDNITCVLNILYEFISVFNPLYRYIDRVGCWCCPFCTKNKWDLARELEPAGYKEFKNFLNIYSVSNVTASENILKIVGDLMLLNI